MSTPQAKGGPVAHESSLSEKSDVDQYPLHGPKLARYNNTPDDTLQSLLWATRNHDLTNILQAFTPERAEQLQANARQSDHSTEDFFRDSAAFVGMWVVGRKQNADDGSVDIEVEVMPGMPHESFSFRQINGQWKIAGPF